MLLGNAEALKGSGDHIVNQGQPFLYKVIFLVLFMLFLHFFLLQELKTSTRRMNLGLQRDG